jgi:riboflavin biosynthesis pyrimidine reductase
MARPRVVCHMMGSVDGRIAVHGWPPGAPLRTEYETVHALYEPDGWLCGRVTMEPFAGRVRPEPEVAGQVAGGPRPDFRGGEGPFAFAADPSGRLAWSGNDIDGDHVVALLTERVSDDYLASLRERGVSYLVAGARELELSLALDKIGALGVRTLLVEGGGAINGALLRAGLVDEVSLLIAPVADGRTGAPAVFDGALPRGLALESVERRGGDVVWLKYRVR